MIFLFVMSFCVFALNAATNYDTYLQRVQQGNNYKAISHRNKAIIYSVLCIIFIIAFACNSKEFHLSNNQFINYPMSEQSNATTADNQSCPWVVNEHGSTIARVNSKT